MQIRMQAVYSQNGEMRAKDGGLFQRKMKIGIISVVVEKCVLKDPILLL